VESWGYSPKTSSSHGTKILIAFRGGCRRPAIPAAESALGSHPCVALSSAQVTPEWINRNLAGNDFAANGDNSLNSVSQPKGSLQPPLSPHPFLRLRPPSCASLRTGFS
jgi:hypothetical protein